VVGCRGGKNKLFLQGNIDTALQLQRELSYIEKQKLQDKKLLEQAELRRLAALEAERMFSLFSRVARFTFEYAVCIITLNFIKQRHGPYNCYTDFVVKTSYAHLKNKLPVKISLRIKIIAGAESL